MRIRGEMAAMCLLGVTTFACEKGHPTNGAKADDIPAALAIGGDVVTVGVQRGVLRSQATVAAFRITELPVRISDYQKCVDKGACELSADARKTCPAWADDTKAAEPASCLSVDEARAYCQWVGGRLPTVSEWLLASRGAAVQSFPWGSSAPSCDQRWSDACADGGACTDPARKDCPKPPLVTGAHPAGASAAGMQDILLASDGELVAGDSSSDLFGCASDKDSCLIRSGPNTPGSIDYITVPRDPESDAGASLAYGFRCAWSGQQ